MSVNTTGDCNDSLASEKAMLKFIRRSGFDFEALRKKYIPKDFTRFVFDPTRKRMSTIIELPEDEAANTKFGFNKRLHVKGASEIVLETCTTYLDENGEKKELDDGIRSHLNEIINSYAKQALRTFAFGYKDLQEGEGGPEHDAREKGAKCFEIEETGLTLICVAGIKDIIRDEVPGAVAKCNRAGVRVRMVTGDNIVTAIAIAKECGIMNEGEEIDNPSSCMEGPEFNEFVGSLINKKTKERIMVMGKDPGLEAIGNMENMRIIRKNLKVLARSRPNDKYIMVFGLKELGDIVAVTGDGTNDAPALKKANVGFAMKTGTQVAHTAADIIIQDDNFASIVKACKWGRNVYDNIRRFL
jgi:magnesium-transporting ATPase (P-type)